MGRRDTLVTLQRYTATQDEYGQEVEAWEPIGREWVAIYFGRGRERRMAAMEQGNQVATFRMLSNDLTRSLSLKDRIDSGSLWDIQGIAPDTPRRGEIELTAIRGG